MRSSRKLVAGLLDAGSSALGTFLAGIVAVRELPTQALSVYAVLFSASVFAMLLPRNLHYIPAQLGANLHDGRRAPLILRDVRDGVLASTGAFVVVLGVALTLVRVASLTTCLQLGLTAAVFSVVSPIQDHVRSSLHLVDRHLSAAMCSVVLAACVGVGTVIGIAGRGATWLPLVPFGAMLVGNAVSLAVGARLLAGAPPHHEYERQTLVVRGRLLLSELAVQGGWFGCNYAILLILGAAVLAHLEAARVVASPITIVTTALITFMGPAVLRRITPTRERPRGPGRDLVIFSGAIVAAAAAYVLLLLVGGPVVVAILNKPLNLPLVTLRMSEFIIEGVAAMAALVVFAIGRSRVTLSSSVGAGAVGLTGTAAFATVLGAFALPLGQAAGMVVRLALCLVTIRRSTVAKLRELELVAAP